MKKYIYLTTIATLALTSCLKKESKETSQDQANTIQEVEYKAPQYLSPDLAMQELGGKVKSMEYSVYNCDANGNRIDDDGSDAQALLFFFSADGTMTKGFVYEKGEMGPKLIRNDKGQIDHTERMLIEYDFTYINSFEYNTDGTVAGEKIKAPEFSCTTKNEYKEGVLVGATAEERGEGTIYTTTSTFKVLGVDAQGNWVKRFCSSTIQSGPDDGSGTITETGTTHNIETRKIIYY